MALLHLTWLKNKILSYKALIAIALTFPEVLAIKIRSLKIKNISNTKDKLFHVSIVCDLREIACTSSGVSTSIFHAGRIAAGELVENLAFLKSTSIEQSRNGWAAFPDLEEAKYRAYKELVERDAFLTCLYGKNVKSVPVNQDLRTYGTTVHVTQLLSMSKEISVCLAGIQDKDGKWYLGLGSANNLNESSEKAIFESLMIYEAWSSFGGESKDKKHELLSKNLEASSNKVMSKKLSSLFSGKGSAEPVFPAISKDDTSFELVEKFSSFYVVKGSHPEFLTLSFGENWIARKMELETTLRRRGLELEFWLPHPFL